MLREIGLFGALAPSLLLYFIASVVLFVVVDRVLRWLAFYRLTWHPALARFGLFLCLFAALVFSTQ
jgi:protein AaeX